MANPRKAAEHAISLLEQALRDSETRIAELDEEVNRQRPTKSQVESKLEVVTHRLGLAEQERDRWKTDAEHMEAVLENERRRCLAARRGTWKLLRCDGSEPRLFDLSRDPREREDLAARRPEVTRSLLAALEEREASLRGDPGGEVRDGLEEERRRELEAIGYL